MKVQIINGPNLNLLGSREPDIYGQTAFDTFFNDLQSQYPMVELSYYQSNIEGELIDKMQEVGFTYDGIILNAGAYTHTSIALLDCCLYTYLRTHGTPEHIVCRLLLEKKKLNERTNGTTVR